MNLAQNLSIDLLEELLSDLESEAPGPLQLLTSTELSNVFSHVMNDDEQTTQSQYQPLLALRAASSDYRRLSIHVSGELRL
jgi:hypothetical protein